MTRQPHTHRTNMRWRMLALLFLARVGLGFQFQTMASVSDPLQSAFELDYATIGLLIGLFMLPGLVLSFPAGYAGQRIADRPLAVGGLVCLAVGGVVAALATGPLGIGIGRLVAGAGFVFTTLYFTKMVADWFDGGEIATAMSIFVMSWPFGIAMGQVGHTWLSEVFSWRLPFLVASAYCLLAALAVHMLYQAPRRAAASAPRAGARLTGQEWRLVVCAGFAWGIFNAAYILYLSFGPKMLESLGFATLAAASTVSITSWVMIGSGALCGQIVDRLGRREVVLVTCMAGAVVSLWLLTQPDMGLAASLMFGLVGMAPAGVIMALSGLAMRPEVRPFGMGVFFTVYYAVMMATPPIAGAVLDATGRPESPLWLAMALCALVVPTALAFRYFKADKTTLAEA